jgi:dihydroneopterin aldolase
MPSDITTAFDHPDARAAASAGANPLDRISLRNHITKVEIGAFQSERNTTQRLAFNVVVEVLPAGDPLDDDVDRILSYDTITQAIDDELAAGRLNLLETLAENVAERILREPQADRVFLRVEKLDRGSGELGVEIVRQRAEIASRPQTSPQQATTSRPVLVFLDNDLLADAHLGKWLDALVRHPEPVVICVDRPAQSPVQSKDKPVQHRIDLLAIEQNAWALAGLDPRCVVVATRTELDWGMRNAQLSVWAPSKMVLDAGATDQGAEVLATDPRQLARWLADQLDASRVVDLPMAPINGEFAIPTASEPS